MGVENLAGTVKRFAPDVAEVLTQRYAMAQQRQGGANLQISPEITDNSVSVLRSNTVDMDERIRVALDSKVKKPNADGKVLF